MGYFIDLRASSFVFLSKLKVLLPLFVLYSVAVASVAGCPTVGTGNRKTCLLHKKGGWKKSY